MKTSFRKELEAELLITIEGVLWKYNKKAAVSINKQLRGAVKQLSKKFNKAVKKEEKKTKAKKTRVQPKTKVAVKKAIGQKRSR